MEKFFNKVYKYERSENFEELMIYMGKFTEKFHFPSNEICRFFAVWCKILISLLFDTFVQRFSNFFGSRHMWKTWKILHEKFSARNTKIEFEWKFYQFAYNF